MPDRRPFVYWDADVFVNYADQNRADRWPVLDAILAESADPKGQHRVITSTLSITEVAYVGQELTVGLDPKIETRLDAFWQPDGAILVCEFHPGIAREARAFIRLGVQHRIRRLRPADAIHLATAVAMGAAEFQTYNLADFLPYAPFVGFQICEPHAIQPTLFNLGGT